MKTKKLHELIELAQAGKKFKARTVQGLCWFNYSDLKNGDWSPHYIVADWEYKEIRDPEVVEFECKWVRDVFHYIYPSGDNILSTLKSMIGRKWKVTCVEILEEE